MRGWIRSLDFHTWRCVSMKVDMSANAVSTNNYEVNSAAAKPEVKKVVKPTNEPKEVRVDISEKDKKKIKAEVEAVNKKLENSDTSIRFKVHESEHSENNKISIAVVDKESEKVIRIHISRLPSYKK